MENQAHFNAPMVPFFFLRFLGHCFCFCFFSFFGHSGNVQYMARLPLPPSLFLFPSLRFLLKLCFKKGSVVNLYMLFVKRVQGYGALRAYILLMCIRCCGWCKLLFEQARPPDCYNAALDRILSNMFQRIPGELGYNHIIRRKSTCICTVTSFGPYKKGTKRHKKVYLVYTYYRQACT